MLTDSDIEFLKKECQELESLLIPACEIKLMIVLGEGMHAHAVNNNLLCLLLNLSRTVW